MSNFYLRRSVALIFILVIFSGFKVSAQPGSILLYGGVNVDYSRTHEIKEKNFKLLVGAGYQLNDFWTLGIESSAANYQLVSTEIFKDHSWSIGPFAQYFIPLNERFGFFVEAVPAFKQSAHLGSGFIFSLFPALYMNVGPDWGLYLIPGGVFYDPHFDGPAWSINFNSIPIIGVSKNFSFHKK